MRRSIIALSGLLISITGLFAQEKTNFFKLDKIVLHTGLHMGGVTPTSLPAEIREIEGYTPLSPVTLGVEIPFFQINQKLELFTGLNLKGKGMKAGAFVENYRGMLNFENTPYQNIYGYFTGSVKSQFNNWYLEVPLAARYAINAKWNALAGISYSQAIARSFEGTVANAYIRLGAPTTPQIHVPNATFKTSNQIRKYDIGAQVGAEYILLASWNVSGILNYGFSNVLDAPVENLPVSLHNIFFGLSVGYAIPFHK